MTDHIIIPSLSDGQKLGSWLDENGDLVQHVNDFRGPEFYLEYFPGSAWANGDLMLAIHVDSSDRIVVVDGLWMAVPQHLNTSSAVLETYKLEWGKLTGTAAAGTAITINPRRTSQSVPSWLTAKAGETGLTMAVNLTRWRLAGRSNDISNKANQDLAGEQSLLRHTFSAGAWKLESGETWGLKLTQAYAGDGSTLSAPAVKVGVQAALRLVRE